MRAALALLMIAFTPFGFVSCSKDNARPIGATQAFWDRVHYFVPGVVSMMDLRPGWFREIKLQLKSTNPSWADVMIQRYVAWLDAKGEQIQWNDLEISHRVDVWQGDGYDPSDFFNEYVADFGYTDVHTGISEYVFPQMRPSSPADPTQTPPDDTVDDTGKTGPPTRLPPTRPPVDDPQGDGGTVTLPPTVTAVAAGVWLPLLLLLPFLTLTRNA